MKYLVTAGAGFIGSHLTERLLNDGHSVTVLDNLSTGQLSNISHLLENESLKVVEGDIRQKESLEEHIQQADRIFHLAAAVGVLNIVNDPIGSMETNLVGSSNMFSLALKYKKPIFITSSSEIYGTGLQTRCFSHVLDVVDGIVKVESCTPAAGRPVNVGVAQEISIVALARKIIELTDSSSEIRFKDYASAYEKGYEDMERRVPNTTLLRSLTGWEPKRDVDKIIIDVAQYLRAL